MLSMHFIYLLSSTLLFMLGKTSQGIVIRSVENTNTRHAIAVSENQDKIFWNKTASDTLKLNIDPISYKDLINYSQDTFEFFISSEKQAAGTIEIVFVDQDGHSVLSSNISTNYVGLRRFTISCRYDMQRYDSTGDVKGIYFVAKGQDSKLTLHLPLNHAARRNKRIKNIYLKEVKGFFSDTTYNHFYGIPPPSAYDTLNAKTVSRLKLAKESYQDFLLKYKAGQNCQGEYLYEKEMKELDSNKVRLKRQLRSQRLINITPESAGVALLSVVKHLVQNNTSKDIKLVNEVVGQVYQKGFAENSEITYNQYFLREYFQALLLSYPYLSEENKLRVDNTLVWYLKVNKIFDPTYKPEPYFSDLVRNQYIFIMGWIFNLAPQKRAQYLEALRRHLDRVFANSSIKSGWIKPDGTSFHHNSQYIAYMYSFNEMIDLIGFLEESGFPLEDKSAETFRDAVSAILIVSNKGRYTNNLGGRHPFRTENPICQKGLVKLSKILAKRQLKSNLDVEDLFYNRYSSIQGFWQFNYGNMGVYRTDGYVMVAKGFSKNFWGSEIYARENRFGKYQGYGTLEIIDSTGFHASGFEEHGWNWNRPPGSTTINLPDNKLNPPKARVDEYTNTNFSGSLSIGRIEDGTQLNRGRGGVFAMNFIEQKNSPNHDESFGFRKSYHFYKGKALCLGSGISKERSPYEVTTNIVQVKSNKEESTSLEGNNFRFVINEKEILKEDLPFVFARGALYYCVYDATNVQVNRKVQRNRNSTDTREYSGRFTNVFINHGTAPENETYEYLISTKQCDINQKPYVVKQQDDLAHVVMFEDGREDYVIYKPKRSAGEMTLLESTIGILSLKETNDTLTINFTNPGLEFDDKGVAIGQSHEVKIKGAYQLIRATQPVVIEPDSMSTKILFEAGHGKMLEIQLRRHKK